MLATFYAYGVIVAQVRWVVAQDILGDTFVIIIIIIVLTKVKQVLLDIIGQNYN